MAWRALALLVILGGCKAQLYDASRVDARPSGNSGDSGAVVGDDASVAPPDGPKCFNGRVVYLNFDGVTLTKNATTDATANTASWIGVTTANVPPYHNGQTNRATDITNITTRVTQILSTLPVTVVTARPAAGPYVMIVFGGSSQTVGSVYAGSTSDHDCGDLIKSDVGWVSDSSPTGKAGDTAVGAIGWALGLQGTNNPGDCMCEWANNCIQDNDTACALSTTNIATTNSQSPSITCPGENPQNETAAFTTAFCD